MTDTGKVLVTGATGNVGSAVLDNLGTTDPDPRALVRDESKARTMRDRGVEAIVGDFFESDVWGELETPVDAGGALEEPLVDEVAPE